MKYLDLMELLQILQFSYKHKRQYISVSIPKNLLKTLFLLQQVGLIYTYLKTNESIIIYLKYFHNQPVWQSLHFFSKNSHSHYIKYKNLKKLVFKPSLSTTIFLVNTKLGILSGVEAITKKISGTLIAKIN